jgi:hypothetical protein
MTLPVSRSVVTMRLLRCLRPGGFRVRAVRSHDEQLTMGRYVIETEDGLTLARFDDLESIARELYCLAPHETLI